jgi:2-methylcitrate dehydratase PrpD
VLPGAKGDSVKVQVVMNDGREFSESSDAAKGAPQNPMSKDDVLAKYWANVDYSKTVTRKNAEKLLALLENLEGLDNVNRIVPLLVA